MLRKLRLTAIVLLLFNSLGALWGGAGLVYDPTGEFMQMPLDYIKHSPFSTYLIPGIILFIANGLFSLIVAIATMKKGKYYVHLIIAQGLILAIWLSVQIAMIQIFYPPLHLPFYLISLALIVIGSVLLRGQKQ